ncbi:PriCT-2 domain-containing protein [Aliiroseovarius crassostreae]|uniref:VapE domain-containing protein n=1 Tax=Aliiroseovarius crassostreae TaxID=154981 RepID=UPI0021B08B45|nr:VapE domain-containing protein [Aliiroseovarius crassostreae]UWQ10232.1 PriCT-2 domain-containing protein [Aliiroseovarius crassostreae]
MPHKNTDPKTAPQGFGFPLTLTRFPTRGAFQKKELTLSLADLARWIADQRAESKDGLPWIKLATFGPDKTPKKSLRHNANVRTVTGLEADYDAGTMTPEAARDALKKAGVAGLVYTTPSHSPDAPRWRVLAPFSGPLPPEAREDLMARLNGILGGALDPASFTLSQSYYAGNVEGGTPVVTFLVDGQPIDMVDGLAPIYKDGGSVKRERRAASGEGLALQHVREALLTIPNDASNPDAAERLWWLHMGMALHHATGGSEDGLALFHEWSERHPSYDSDETAEVWDSFGGGGKNPRTFATIRAEAERRGWIDLSAFDDVIPADELAEIDDLIGLPAIPEGPDWGSVIRERGKPVNNLNNAIVYLGRNLDSILPGLRHNLMTRRDEWCDGPLNDAALALARTGLERRGLRTVGKELVADAALTVARHLQYHPIRDQLRSLHHDGRERLDSWLVRYAGAADTPYTRAVGRKFLLQMVARVMEPGCKADHTLVLSGPQGIGKSTACRILAGSEYFSDTLPSIAGDKTDAIRHLQGKWLVELAELAPSRKSEAEDLKAFLSGAVDRVRLPYARFDESFPRQCVFVGTTNEDQFLRDATGGRRFWPVTVHQIDLEALASERDQLFAEAFAAYEAGEAWCLDRDFEAAHARPVQEAARESDAWADDVAEWLDKPADDFDAAGEVKSEVRISEVLSGALGLNSGQQTRANQKRVADILRTLGWGKIHTRRGKLWARV